MNANIVSSEEMAIALDHEAPVTPSKFIPYRKVLGELESVRSVLAGEVDVLMELEALFNSIAGLLEGEAVQLARLGRRAAREHAAQLADVHECSGEVSASARKTTPRKRWDESNCPDDQPYDDDLAREAAASVRRDDEPDSGGASA